MADCECLEGCPFFNDNMINMPSTAELLKKRYCKADFDQCARYIVFKALGKSHVPSDLIPNQVDRVKTILRDSGK